MKEFLAFSDFHAHNFAYGSKIVPIPGFQGGYNSRLRDAVAVLREVFEYARANNVSSLLFGGDLFHERSAVKTDVSFIIQSTIRQELDKSPGAELVALVGNHDMGDKHGNVHSLVGLESHPRIHVANTFGVTKVGNQSVILIPYVPHLDTAQDWIAKAHEIAKEDIAKGLPKPVLLAHLGMQGARVGGDFVLVSDHDISSTDIDPDMFSACLFGHFHEHQNLFRNGWYIGATHEHNWGDTGGSRGFLHVKIHDDGRVELKQIETSAPKFVVATDPSQVRECDFVRVPYSEQEELSALWKAFDKFDNVETVLQGPEVSVESLDLKDLSPSYALQEWLDSKGIEGEHKDRLLKLGKELLGTYE